MGHDGQWRGFHPSWSATEQARSKPSVRSAAFASDVRIQPLEGSEGLNALALSGGWYSNVLASTQSEFLQPNADCRSNPSTRPPTNRSQLCRSGIRLRTSRLAGDAFGCRSSAGHRETPTH